MRTSNSVSTNMTGVRIDQEGDRITPELTQEAIFAKDIVAPKFATQGQWSWNRDSTEDEWPLLRRGSDIMWSYWFRGNPNVKSLRMYSAHSVINKESNLLAPRAFMKTGLNHLNQWPGHTFDTATDEGKALLSKPEIPVTRVAGCISKARD
jgi:hypothetical protein